jgi:crotonobetainyl-CoA:carnitine CoA-transferase CaiB-like acyl-CoA transferase
MSPGIDFPGFVDELVRVNGLDVRAATSIALAEYGHDVNLFNELADLVRAQSQFTQGTVLVAASGNESQRDKSDKKCDEKATWAQRMIATTGSVGAGGLVAQLVARADPTRMAAGFTSDDFGSGMVHRHGPPGLRLRVAAVVRSVDRRDRVRPGPGGEPRPRGADPVTPSPADPADGTTAGATADATTDATAGDLRHGPLTGITVVDVTVAIQGPHASAYLVDMGAEVVKVERPGGELNRYVRGPGLTMGPEVMGSQYVAMNRGKRGIVVDAHEELGREVLHRLLASADVFVTNYRREALDRMGLGWDELSAINPGLVYGRVSGFGTAGPDGDKAMLDGASQARSGLAAMSGPADGPPMPPGAAVADHTGAMQLALGIMTALFARERTGRGQLVDTSSLGAMMWIQSWELTHAAMAQDPHAASRAGGHHPNILCPYGVYETSDGGAFMLAVALSDESWDAFWTFAGQPEVVIDDRWANAARRIGARGSTDGVDEIRARMRDAFASRTTGEWAEFLAGQPEIIWERVQDYPEVLADPQVAANGYLRDVEVPGFGPARVVTNVVHLSDTPGSGFRRPAPELGQHTAEVMTELGFGADDIERVLAMGDGAVAAAIDLIYGHDG